MSFIKNLIEGWNGKGQSKINEDADPDTIVKTIQESKSVEEIRAEATVELSASFESQISALTSENEGLKNSLTDSETKFNTMKAENDTMIITASEAKTQIESLQSENSKLQTEKTELSGKLAGRIASNLTDTHDEPPRFEKSETEKDFLARNEKLRTEAAKENAKIN